MMPCLEVNTGPSGWVILKVGKWASTLRSLENHLQCLDFEASETHRYFLVFSHLRPVHFWLGGEIF